jgi:hypothetical protein
MRGGGKPARRASKPYDPFAPLTPKQQTKQVHKLVSSQTVPLISAINKEYAQHVKSGEMAIGGYTNALYRQLQPMAEQTHATYATALGQQAADDAALANRLAGVGGEVAQNLRAQTGLDPTQAAALAAAAQTQGAGAGATVAGLGTAARGALRGAGTAAEAYAGELPGIARIAGQQQESRLRGQLEYERQRSVSGIREKLPALTQQVAKDIRDTELQKAIAVQSGLVEKQKLRSDIAYKRAQARATAAYHAAQIGLGKGRLAQGWQRLDLQTAKAKSDALFKQAGLDLKRDNYNLAVTREHRLSLAQKGKKGGFTPSQISKMRSTAIETAKDWKHGVPASHYASGKVKSPGQKGHPDVMAGKGLLRFLVNHGIPPTMAAWATTQVYGSTAWKNTPAQKRAARGGAAAVTKAVGSLGF